LDLALVGALATLKELGLNNRQFEAEMRERLFVLARKGESDPQILQNELLKPFKLDIRLQAGRPPRSAISASYSESVLGP